MRCEDAKEWMGVQRDGDLAPEDVQALDEHLKACIACQAVERRLKRVSGILPMAMSGIQSSISTDRIMLAIQDQRRASQQLEDIRQLQQSRLARLRPIGAACTALGIFTLSSIPLLLLIMLVMQTDLVIKAVHLFNGVIDLSIILAQYLQVELTIVTHNSWLLSGLSFAIVVMMGMWLRLMRHPQEA